MQELITPSRKLIHEGLVAYVTSHGRLRQRYIYLFSDLILMVKLKKLTVGADDKLNQKDLELGKTGFFGYRKKLYNFRSAVSLMITPLTWADDVPDSLVLTN